MKNNQIIQESHEYVFNSIVGLKDKEEIDPAPIGNKFNRCGVDWDRSDLEYEAARDLEDLYGEERKYEN